MKLVSVSEVRRVLYWAAGGPASGGAGEPTEAVLGTLFHSVFTGLTGPDERTNLVRPLERADARPEAWRSELVEHAWAWHVAPALAEHASTLQGRGHAVPVFWAAVQELCGWLAGVVWEQVRSGLTVSEARRAVFVVHEQEVARELSRPSWSEPVTLYGRVDAVLRQPATGISCIFELKTGRAAPEADVCQAALYHLLHGAGPGAHLAVVAFQPEPREHLFEPAQLDEAKARLEDLVARLAGVVSGEDPPAAPAADASHAGLGRRLVEAYAEYGVAMKLEGEPLAGPTFVRFFVRAGRGVRPKQVKDYATAVWTRIRTSEAPQVSVQEGRLAIDVQRPDRQVVPWAQVRVALPTGGSSRFPIGVAVDGTLRWADLARPENSHFLVAGTAGSGKSEWLRAMVASLLASNTPATLKLVLIDPKRTAFVSFEGAPVLLRPVVYPSDEDVLAVFDGLVAEMEDRYRLLAEARVQDLASLDGARPPRVVVLCDEFADLLMSGDRKQRQEVETRMTRLAQKGRAAGLHLVLATQQPSRRIVTGALDANLMARVALKVARDIESSMVIGDGRAATLLGRGDLLFKDLGEPVRLQSPWVREDELRALLRL